MDRRSLTDHVVVADLDPGLRAVKFRVLRVSTDDRMCIDCVVLADAAILSDYCMWAYRRSGSYMDIVFDNGKWADYNRRIYLRLP